jgi:predicted AAA+ superfamily ATPase
MNYKRPYAKILASRLREPRHLIQVITGPRQVGKTTLVEQVCSTQRLPFVFASADEPTLKGPEWIAQQWESARIKLNQKGAILVIDEIQKVIGWTETVKRLWDEDTRKRRPLKLILLGSAPLLLQHGLTESLSGRFELIHLPHWSFTEMNTAFGFDIEKYIFFGGYPGAAPLINDQKRWVRYIRDALIETTISRDVLLLTRVDKPALLRQLFELGCLYSGQIISYSKMLGQLQDAGNTTTLAHYLHLLAAAGMLVGLPKYTQRAMQLRASSPKLQVLNTALMSAQCDMSFAEARENHEFWGHLVESAVGAHLANAEAVGSHKLFYWRERNHEVDFVVKAGRTLVALEVKSGHKRQVLPGIATFTNIFKPKRSLLIGGDGIPIEEFLKLPIEKWLGS